MTCRFLNGRADEPAVSAINGMLWQLAHPTPDPRPEAGRRDRAPSPVGRPPRIAGPDPDRRARAAPDIRFSGTE